MNATQKRFLTNFTLGTVSSLITERFLRKTGWRWKYAMYGGFLTAVVAELYFKPPAKPEDYEAQLEAKSAQLQITANELTANPFDTIV